MTEEVKVYARQDEYIVLLSQLRRNKENVSMEELRAKYQKPYMKLKKELKQMTEEILKAVVFMDLKVERIYKDKVCQKINQDIEASGLLAKISHAVYQEQNADMVLIYAIEMRKVVHQAEKEAMRTYDV